ALTFELPDKEQACFHQKFEGSTKYVFSYEVIRGGNLDVDVTVVSPNGLMLHDQNKIKKGVFEFETSYGVYTFCFSNLFSSFTHKVIYFELRPEVHRNLAYEAGRKLPHANTYVEESLESVHIAMSQVTEYQTEYRLREFIGRYVAENVNDRVTWWSAAQALIILVVVCGQVVILKLFFTERV
ncbi:Transmembrane emp24 domain-containing protein 7, partial [Lamellibrachia satsuma]